MWTKLISHSFLRDRKRKVVAILAVCLATCLATFLLNWSLNVGDKIQRDLRSYGSNIVIVPQGESLPWISEFSDSSQVFGDRYLQMDDVKKLNKIFWRNQILAVAPVLTASVLYKAEPVVLVGTEFGEKEAISDLRKVSTYLQVRGSWPKANTEVVSGELLSEKMHWKLGETIELQSGNRMKSFHLTGIVSSGSVEDHQMFARLGSVQELVNQPGSFKNLLISALVTPPNNLYWKHQRNPDSLTPQEFERYSCTPYVTSVARDISKVVGGSEARIVRRITQTEEKIVKKVNWLMILVTLAALVASSLTMTSTTTAMILERRKELALMKALGSNNGFIVATLFVEILVLGAIGSIAGYAIGTFLTLSLSAAIFEYSFELKWIVLPLVFFVGTMVIVCGSVWPLRNAITLDPAHALKDL